MQKTKHRPLKKIICILLTQFIFSFQLFSQNDTIIDYYSISGKITDSIENNALAYVNLTLLSAKDSSYIKSGISNETGNFSIKEIEKGEYILRIIDLSYKQLYKPITLNKDITLDLFLHKPDAELDEVIISADKEIYRLETDKRIYLTKNDESIQNAFAEDALENAPGVYIDVDGNVIIRGKPASVWINGKPSKRKNENLKSYLKLLPASRIEKIEVITNPSARYTATNTNSIVNIVLKKKVYENSLLAFGTVINTANIFGAWTTAYITRKKFDFNIYVIGSQASLKYLYYDKSFSLINKDTAFYSEFRKNEFYSNKGAKVFSELTYHINDKTDIDFNIEYLNYSFTDSFENQIIRKYENPEQITSNLIEKDKSQYIFFNLNFNHDFNDKGNNINFEFNAFKDNTDINFYKSENYLFENKNLFRKSYPNQKILDTDFSANYSYPVKNKSVLATGFILNPINSKTYINIVKTSSNTDDNWIEDTVLSNDYIKETPSYEVYSTYKGKISKIKYKIGLRYEHNIYVLKQTIPIIDLQKVYSNLYPSVHFSYLTKSKHNFSLSYSRRVNTPIYHLNPYIDRTNNDYISSGNQNLNFAATNSYEFTYFKSFDKINVTTSLYQRNTKNDIIRVSEPVYDIYFEQTVVLQTYANCGNSKYTGAEISLSSSPVKNLRLQLYSNTYYQNLNGTYNNLPLTNKDFVYNAKLNVSYKFFNKFSVKISPYFKSNKADIFQNTKSNFYTNASLKFDLWNKRLSFDIRARDIFGTRNKISEYYLDNFYHYSEKDYIFQKVQFVAIFRIGNSKYDRKAKINQLAR